MALHHLPQDTVGNPPAHGATSGLNFPLPDDDSWSWDGTENSHGEYQEPDEPLQEFEPPSMATPPTPVCRAGLGSTGEMPVAQTTDIRSIASLTPESRQLHMSLQIDGDNSTWSPFAPPVLGTLIAGEQQSNHIPMGSDPTTAPDTFTGHNFDTASHNGNGQPFVNLTGGTYSSSLETTTSTGCGTKDMSHHEYASTTDLILQNLTMIIGNPSTRCYANAPWRAFCWMCAYLAEFNLEPWGTVKEAVQTSLELTEAIDIKALPGLEDLWKQHDLNLEGDAAHFVNTLWLKSQTRVMQYRYSEIKEQGYLADHVQLPLIVDHPDEFLDEITWQELMNNWANQGLGQFLGDDKTVLVAHINRAVTYDGVLTKHKRALNPHGTFTVPRSLDGFSRASAECIPIAYICHRGPTHDSGHYFTILVYRDLMWIADDGGHPTVLPFLTPQLAGQIVQIWAVETTAFVKPRQIQRAMPEPETPDYDPPLHGTPPKKARHTQDSMKLHVANITTFGRHTLDWLWSRDNDIHILVETHRDKQKHNTMCQYFEVRGKHAFGLPAHTNSTNEGNHGGILILHSNHHGVTQLEHFHIEGCGYQAFLWEAKARSILVIAVYFKTNETIQGPTNSQLLGRLLALVEASNRQYILLGDWNSHPSQFQGTVLGSKFHWQILAPDATLLNGNVLDYALVHNQLAPLTSMSTEWAVPWRPHCLVTYALELPDDFRNYNQLRTFPALPDRPTPGFRPWTTYVTQVEEVLLYDTMPNQSAKSLADWVSITEQYLLQQHPWAPQGRASNLQAEYKPLTSPKAGPIWKKGKPAYWEQL